MNKAEILDKLKNVGFKENESKVLLVLLQGNPMSASEIAKDSGIIRNSIYDILKSFVDKGYCNEIETNTILNYQSIDLQIIIDKIEKEFKSSHEERIKTLNDSFSDIKNFYSNNSHPSEIDKSGQNIELIRGFNKHRMEKFIEIFKRTEKSVHGMYRMRGIVSEELNEIADELIKKGGELKSIYQINLNFKILKNGTAVAATKDDLVRVCESFEKAGEQIRLSEMEIPNMVIFDEEIVFNNISDKEIPKHKQADIIIHNRNNAKYMIDLFNYYWQNGMTIEQFKETENK